MKRFASSAVILKSAAIIALVAMQVSEASAQSKEPPVRIMTGGTTFVKIYRPKQAEIEKTIGAPFEILTAPLDTAVLALSKGAVDGIISGYPIERTLELGEKRGMPKQDPTKYQTFEVYHVEMKIALHPDNPTTNLTHEQIAGILSGKISTWEPINGKKLPIRFLIAKNYLATTDTLYKQYLNAESSPIAEQVVNAEGLLRGIQKDPGAFGFFSNIEELKDFKPKYIDTDARHVSYFIYASNPRSATKKLIEYLKSNVKKVSAP